MKKIGRYEIVEEVGRGAMGVVYKASDPTIGRLVAVKVLSIDPAPGESTIGAQEAFMREVRAAGRLTHPGIVTIHDAFQEPEGRLSCIVMELVAGRTLEEMLLVGPPLEIEKALDIARQVAEGLDYAHQQHVIHRDLKPANILVTEDGRAKITDFGIAKVTVREGAARTMGVMGTPAFMSPEQVTGTDLDARCDLFSLGIILYVMLTGQRPFTGDSAAVMFKIAYVDPALPSTLNPELTPELDYVVLRCLVKDRNKRYASARELLDDLDDIQNRRPPRSQAGFSKLELKTAESTIVTEMPLSLPPPTATLPAPRRSGASMLAVVGALIVAVSLIGIAAWRLSRRRSLPASAVSTTGTLQAVPQPAPVQEQPAPVVQPTASGEATSAATPGDVEAGVNAPPAAEEAPSAAISGEAEAKVKTPRERKASSKHGSAPSSKAGPQEISAASPVAVPAPTPPVVPASTPSNSSAAPPSPKESASVDRIIQLVCRHDLKEGTLAVSSGGQAVFQGTLKGKKKGGFLGIKSGIVGTFSKSIQIPRNAQDLTVHIVTPDGSTDLSRTIPAPPPGGTIATLQVDVKLNKLALNWQAPVQSVHKETAADTKQ